MRKGGSGYLSSSDLNYFSQSFVTTCQREVRISQTQCVSSHVELLSFVRSFVRSIWVLICVTEIKLGETRGSLTGNDRD